jgi:hypothetical protein
MYTTLIFWKQRYFTLGFSNLDTNYAAGGPGPTGNKQLAQSLNPVEATQKY